MNTPFTWQARSSIGRPNDTATWPFASRSGRMRAAAASAT